MRSSLLVAVYLPMVCSRCWNSGATGRVMRILLGFDLVVDPMSADQRQNFWHNWGVCISRRFSIFRLQLCGNGRGRD